MLPKSFLDRVVRNLGSLLLVFAFLTIAVFAATAPNWDPGQAPQKAPGEGNVELSTSSSSSSSGGVDVSCTAGSSLRVIKPDGTVECEVDDVGSSSGGVDTTKTCEDGKAIKSFDLSNDSAPTCVSVGGSSSGSGGGLTAINVDSCDPGFSIRGIDFNISGSAADGSVTCEKDDTASSSSSSGGSSSGGSDCLWTDNGNYISYTYDSMIAKIGKRLTTIDGGSMHGHRTEYGSGQTMVGVTDGGLAGASFKTGGNAFNIFTNGNKAHFRVYKNESFIFDNLGSNLQGGKVGIGTANPTYRLDVVGSIRSSDNVGAQAFYDTNNLDYYLDPSGTSVPNNIQAKGTICDKNGCIGGGGDGTSLWTKSGSNIYYSLGKVGIKTASPQYELDVVGSVRASGFVGGQAFYDTNNLQFKVDPTGASKVNSITATGTICDKNGCIGGGGGGGGTPCDWNGWAIRQVSGDGISLGYGQWAVGETCGGGDVCVTATKVNFYCQGGVITNSGIVNYCRSCQGISP